MKKDNLLNTVEVVLDGITVGSNRPPYIIAEGGHNHMGDIEECKRLMSMTRDAGANAFKIQKRDNKELYTKKFYNSNYNSENSYGPTYGEHRDYLEFTLGQYLELQQFANYLGITFIATAFDLNSLDFLEELDVPFYKIASGSITNPLLLRRVARLGRPILASFGGATDTEVFRAVETLSAQGSPVILLHCVAGYPPKPEDLNLDRILVLQEDYPNNVIGFSDHDDGISMALVAWAKGARVFEKHITMSHTHKGTDHPFSLEYMGLRAYTGNLHEAERASVLQNQPLEVELKPMRKMGSACYFNRDMKVGDIVTVDNLILKSPADGLLGWAYDDLIGSQLEVDVAAESPLDLSMFSWEIKEFDG